MSDHNPDHLWPDFREKILRVVSALQVYLDKHHPGLKCGVVQGYRSADYQHSLWQQGRDSHGNKIGQTVTNADGYRSRSNHQSSCAADIGIFEADGSYIEEPAGEIMRYYGHLVRAEGLEWGGDWHSIVDQPHAQWPASDKASYTKAHEWQRANKL